MIHGTPDGKDIQTDHQDFWLMSWQELKALQSIKEPGRYRIGKVTVIINPKYEPERK